MIRTMTLVMCVALGIELGSAQIGAEDTDYRQYAHGISCVKNPVSEKTWLVWSDAYKQGVDDEGNWTHDVYGLKLNLKKPKIKSVKRLIKADEAQEPASASCTDDGNMIVTFEDGNDAGEDELAQRFAIYNSKMKCVKKYPATIALGGHSGHAASTSDHHIVFWSEGWVDGGGVDDLGTGDDVYVTSMDSAGNDMKTVEVAKGDETRDWWPLIAASETKALLVWQRYVDGEDYAELCCTVYDPKKAEIESFSDNSKEHVFSDIKMRYYTYNVCYIKGLKLFALNLTTIDNKGILFLINESGDIVDKIENCEAFVREAAPAVDESNGEKLYYPVNEDEVECFEIGKDHNVSKSVLKVDFRWSECGTAGFADNNGTAWFAALDTAHFKKHKKTLKLVKVGK